ncbi:1-(5-phosphoribosyl)-5-[(5-phosphoribosylamino)methylideneamino]imidazole-4-carboxamide isomerase [Salinibacter sp. 10B]|uniref:1-(5-phosphoribosyl)-5-[(5- phosphoribosylamino)methylideneamino]imidazole-4- carboxamide isomerase n=1 Tax=Salinibacter sp. 10B TaxID=1923971 RepID=UPI000CF488EF|nr:1-(5-phosphoribosyl)-5-[(5-phosphoribosylamino)methylideneamino]imidazole-4-carboxamide isomerase [Salinibacter sp. 10B]PQJ34033.1 1-(5-phosphoribosyl)-5-[(5-phosphoribosylamino)methylideneamino]imidazole-4-carboxamide isomerase [Salinibacter sp. 10B]
MALVIPAIDLRDGRCVQLHQGDYEEETVYFENPVKMAKLWRVQNARTLHIVDLDAARGDENNNRPVIRKICDALDIPIQLGGGIRSLEQIEEALEMGVYRVILGTAAVRNPDLVEEAIDRFSSNRIVVGIDARDGEVRVQGWTEGSGLDAVEFAKDMEERGVRRIVYTDISRDGTMSGPNVDAYRTMGTHLSKAKITASGGVGGYDDLLSIQTLQPYGVDSVIVGTALYENRFPCQQFWAWHEKDEVDLDTFSTAALREQS